MIWFLENVWEDLLLENPNLELLLVSNTEPNPLLSNVIPNYKNLILIINAFELSSSYQESSLCIAPIFIGGGSSIKTIEALLYGRKVVSSNFGARGFEGWVKMGLIRVANSPLEWKSLILQELSQHWSPSEFKIVIESYKLENWNRDFLEKII